MQEILIITGSLLGALAVCSVALEAPRAAAVLGAIGMWMIAHGS